MFINDTHWPSAMTVTDPSTCVVSVIKSYPDTTASTTGTWPITGGPTPNVTVTVIEGAPLPHLPPIEGPRNRAERRERKKWR